LSFQSIFHAIPLSLFRDPPRRPQEKAAFTKKSTLPNVNYFTKGNFEFGAAQPTKLCKAPLHCARNKCSTAGPVGSSIRQLLMALGKRASAEDLSRR
jgi:hypothetical protein